MRIPKAVKIGAHEYAVKRVPASAIPGDLGRCDYDKLLIRLRNRLCKQKSQEILLHELLHACGYPNLAGKDEEVVDTLGERLLQLLRDNPKLVEYLTT